MNKEDEIEDSLRFCQEIELYYKSGLFDNPHNVFDWERYMPFAQEEVEKKQNDKNKDLEEALQYSAGLRISGDGAAVLEPPTELTDLTEEEEEESFLKVVLIRFVEIIICIVSAFCISAGVNKYVGTHTMVEGTSMENSLQNGDYLLVDKLSYNIGKPKRFDIIIFPYSEDTYYIKRIIGMPGEIIRIADGKIYINGQELAESYGAEAMLDGGVASEEFVIGEGEYFVLGDNRNHSTDSRSENVGTVKEEKIVGKAFFRFYPFNNVGMVE